MKSDAHWAVSSSGDRERERDERGEPQPFARRASRAPDPISDTYAATNAASPAGRAPGARSRRRSPSSRTGNPRKSRNAEQRGPAAPLEPPCRASSRSHCWLSRAAAPGEVPHARDDAHGAPHGEREQVAAGRCPRPAVRGSNATCSECARCSIGNVCAIRCSQPGSPPNSPQTPEMKVSGNGPRSPPRSRSPRWGSAQLTPIPSALKHAVPTTSASTSPGSVVDAARARRRRGAPTASVTALTAAAIDARPSRSARRRTPARQRRPAHPLEDARRRGRRRARSARFMKVAMITAYASSPGTTNASAGMPPRSRGSPWLRLAKMTRNISGSANEKNARVRLRQNDALLVEDLLGGEGEVAAQGARGPARAGRRRRRSSGGLLGQRAGRRPRGVGARR